jgi:CrcB protein
MQGMQSFFLVFIGGGLGATLRLLATNIVRGFNMRLWVATLAVNLIGCLALFLLSRIGLESKSHQLFLKVGLLGSLTTFSTFTFEIVTLIKQGLYTQAATVLLLNVVCGIMIGIGILR